MQTDAIYQRTFDESSENQHTSDCPECSGRVNTTSHETVCESCGLVLADSAVDRGPEWRTFEEDSGTDRQPKRTGAPVTPTRHDDGLSTEIGRELNGADSVTSRKKRLRLGRLRKQQRRTTIRSKVERNQMQGLLEIDRMASALSLPKHVEEQASVLYRSAHDGGLLQGRSIEAMAAASLYAACRCSETARLLGDFTRVARVGESRITNAYDVLNRELGLPTPPPSPDAYLPKFASDVGLGIAVERRAFSILDTAEQHDLVTGRNPAGVAAACLLVAAREVGGQQLTQDDLAAVADVTPVTLRTRRDELLDIRSRPPA